jgi:hypothetical protein
MKPVRQSAGIGMTMDDTTTGRRRCHREKRKAVVVFLVTRLTVSPFGEGSDDVTGV